MSSAGALVELQAPCLSDYVLALVLDYIYTGALPNTCTQQQLCNLLTAARHLQMDELQEALRTEVKTADNTNAIGDDNQPYEDINNTYKYRPLSDTCSGDSLEGEDQCYDEIDTCRRSWKNGANHCYRTDTRPLSNVGTGSSVSTGNCRQVTYLTPQDLIQNIPHTTKVHGVSRVDKEVQKDRFHSAGTVKPESWQMGTGEVQEEETSTAEKIQRLCLTVISKAEEKKTSRKEEDNTHHSPLLHLSTSHFKDRVCSSSSSPSSSHPCCGAVPVIRHSSTTAMVEASATLPKSWDCKDSSDQCATQDLWYKSNAEQSDVRKQDYISSNTAHDEHMGNGLSHSTDDNDHHAYCDSFQKKGNTKHLGCDSVTQNKDSSSFTRVLKCKTDLSFEEFPSKHQRLDCSDRHNAAEEPSIRSKDLRAVVPLPVQELDTGSDPHFEDLCSEVEAKEERSYSSGSPVQMDRQDTHSNLWEPKNDQYPNLPRAETSRKDAASSQHEHDDKDTSVDNVTGVASLQHEGVQGVEVSEPRLNFTLLADDNMSDSANDVVGQSYRGHLHYHCLPQTDTHLSHRDSDHSLSHPDHSDQSNDDEEVGTAASPDLSPLRQHFATTDQVLLLDISAKPAELLVSYRHRPDEEEKWAAFGRRNPFGNGLGEKDREQRNEATSVSGVDERKRKEQARPGPEIIHKAGGVAGESQATTLAVCAPPPVPDSAQTPVSSSLSVCMPSALSVSMPTNISAPLSTPVHPFHCSLCDRSFSQRGSLNRHVRSHLGVRPFPCPRCPMTFSRQYRVSEHMRVHQRCVLGSDFQKPPASSM